MIVHLFFQNPYANFAQILQHYHDFQSNVAVFSSLVQPYSFDGRIKLIICQIRQELSSTIHEIITSWKKNVRWRTQYIRVWCLFLFFLFVCLLDVCFHSPFIYASCLLFMWLLNEVICRYCSCCCCCFFSSDWHWLKTDAVIHIRCWHGKFQSKWLMNTSNNFCTVRVSWLARKWACISRKR